MSEDLNYSYKYILVRDWILENIRNGSFKPNSKLPSENLLCRKFSVSRQTVRNAVQSLCDDGSIYKVKGSGTYVSKKRSHTNSKKIGILMSYMSDYLFSYIYQGIQEVLITDNYTFNLTVTNNRLEPERVFLEEMLRSDVAGLIVEGTKTVLPNPNIKYYKELENRGIPFVFIHNYYPEIKCNTFLTDDTGSAHQMTKMLIDAGHKKIACIFKGDDIQGLRRYQGYAEALYEAGLPIREELVGWFYTNWCNNILFGADIKNVLESLEDFTAIVCYNDNVALEVCEIFKSCNMFIPDDLSLVSFDDVKIASFIGNNGVVSAKHPHKLLGIEAATCLLRMIREGVDVSEHKIVTMPMEIIVRDSIKTQLLEK
jgi:GntR family transcriptional regulator of arabinose operon